MKLRHKKPCSECPFLKKSTPGYFGGNEPRKYFEDAHSEVGVVCHKTMGKAQEAACVGALQHANKSFKSYRNQDLAAMQKAVGTNPDVLGLKEFYEHHMPGVMKRPRGRR